MPAPTRHIPSPEKDAPLRPPGRRPPPFLAALCTLLAVAALGFAGYLLLIGYAPIAPPTPALDGLDPAIAEVLTRQQARVRAEPRSAPAWGALGQAFLVYDFKPEAAACFAQAERLDRSEPRWAYFHGLSMFPDHVDLGLDRLARAVHLVGDTLDAPRLRLAQILAERGFVDLAEPHYRHLLQSDPNHAPARLGLARIALVRGQPEECLSLLAPCLSHPATARGAHLLSVTAHRRLGHENEADAAARRAATLPHDTPFQDPFIDEASQWRTGRKAWLDHAQQWIRQGRLADAEPLLIRTVTEYPDFADAWTVLGGLHLRRNRPAEAEAALREAIRLEPASVEAQVQRGVALIRLARFEEAIPPISLALQLQPTLAEAHFNLGFCQAQLGRTDDAMASFRHAIRAKPDLTEAYLGLASLLAGADRIAEARTHAEQALELNPSDPRARELLRQLSATAP